MAKASAEEILEELGKNIEEWHPRLMAYSLKRASELYFINRCDGKLPKGEEAQNFIFRAIEKLQNGQCTWDPDKEPALINVIFGIIRRDMGRFAIATSKSAEYSIDGDPILSACVSAIDPDPLEEAAQKAIDEKNGEFILSLYDSLNDEEKKFVEYVTCETTQKDQLTPRDISKATGLEVKTVYNVKKRLARKLHEHHEKQFQPLQLETEG